MPALDDPLRRFQHVLDTAGVEDALRLLNSLQRRRYTALYLFQGHALRNAYLVDRDQPGRATFDDIPVMASYCVFVRDSQASVAIADAVRDPRAASHPKRDTIRSYCGVPLLDEYGLAYGSLCHFDAEPDPDASAQSDTELLEAIGPLLYRRVAGL